MFSTPLIIGVLVFAIYPMIAALFMSFRRASTSFGGDWIGLDNYRYIVSDSLFWQALGNTLYMGVLSVILGVSLSFILASLIYNVPTTRWQNFFKGIYFFT